jgi:glycosyltransferase involved in cell wall biosynthesis
MGSGISTHVDGLSVFLPCHNEAANVERVVRGFLGELPTVAEQYEVIIVDDGSQDGTYEIAEGLARESPHVKVVRHRLNCGYGGAVISGIRAASLPYVLLADGDGQFDPAEMSRLTAKAHENDVVVGCRIERADNAIRKANGKAWTMLVRLLFGVRISDVDCGFKLFRRDLLDGIELRAQGAMISTELMVRVAARRARIAEVGVHHLPRRGGKQSGANVKVIVKAFKELFILYSILRREDLGKGNPDGLELGEVATSKVSDGLSTR